MYSYTYAIGRDIPTQAWNNFFPYAMDEWYYIPRLVAVDGMVPNDAFEWATFTVWDSAGTYYGRYWYFYVRLCIIENLPEYGIGEGSPAVLVNFGYNSRAGDVIESPENVQGKLMQSLQAHNWASHYILGAGIYLQGNAPEVVLRRFLMPSEVG